MKNSDMPAMPLSGDAYNDFAGYVPGKTSFNPECQGLTKREMIAMHAMQGELAGSANHSRPDPEDVAHFAVKCADALLKELER